MARARPERTKGFDGLPSVLGGWPTLPAFGRVGVLTSFPEKANPPASRKPRGIGHPQLQLQFKGPPAIGASTQIHLTVPISAPRLVLWK